MAEYDLKALRKCADAATDAAHLVDGSINWCVNWGDLSCISAQKYDNDDGNAGYRVIIEEASCYYLATFIESYLAEHGFHDVEVITEW